MNLMGSVSIRSKILLVAIVGVVSSGLTLLYNYGVSTANAERLSNIESVYFPVLERSSENIVARERMTEIFKASVATREIEMLTSAESFYKQIKDNFVAMKKLYPDGDKRFDSAEVSLDTYYTISYGISKGMIDGTLPMSQLRKKIQQMNDSLKAVTDEFDQLKVDSLNKFNNTLHHTSQSAADAVMVSLIVTLVSVVAVVLAAGYVAGVIAESINSVVSSLKDIANGEGDLTKRIKNDSKDEIGDLVFWFNSFVQKLHDIIERVVQSVEPLSTISHELNDLGEESKSVVKEQKKATVRVSTSVEEMLLSINDIATHASEAASKAKTTDAVVTKGRGVAETTVGEIDLFVSEVVATGHAIRALKEDTESVSLIIDVIQGIAAQINLLALNAAIEAARAGEQGRGFAVVADEVRTLALRTHKSTQEIQEVIDKLLASSEASVGAMTASEERAQESVKHVAETDQTFGDIAEKVMAINSMNTQIASATEKQQRTSLSIKNDIQSIQDVSNESTESTKKMIEAVLSLSAISDSMSSISKQFKL